MIPIITVNEALQNDRLNGSFVVISGHLVNGCSLYLNSDVPFDSLKKHVVGTNEFSSTSAASVALSRSIIIATPGIHHLFRNYAAGGGVAVLGNAIVCGRLEVCDRAPIKKKLVAVWEISWHKSDGTLLKADFPNIEEQRISGMKEIYSYAKMSLVEKQECMTLIQRSFEKW